MALITILLTDTFDEWRLKCNEGFIGLGDAAGLNTTAENAVDAINEILLDSGNVGNLTLLTTTNKDDLVSAINEVDALAKANDLKNDEIGTLSSLTTTIKTDLVSAINEVDALAKSNEIDIGVVDAEVGDLSLLTTTQKTDVVTAINEIVNRTLANYDLAAIDVDFLTASDIIDIFVYDTKKDSDGGLWRTTCADKSWYRETLNTATRGAKQEFPAVAIVVAETDRVVIYDATDSSVGMWKVLLPWVHTTVGEEWWRAGRYPSAVYMMNGKLAIAKDDSGTIGETGLSYVDFLKDEFGEYTGSANPSLGGRATPITSMGSETLDGSLPSIAGEVCRDVAMGVLHEATVDPITGLPVTTIGVGTHTGVTIIDGPAGIGTAIDIIFSEGGDYINTYGIEFLQDRVLLSTHADTAIILDVPSTDVTTSYLLEDYYSDAVAPYIGGLSTGVDKIAKNKRDFVIASNANGGFSCVDVNSTKANGMVADITRTYNTGWMPGDIKGAFLANSKTIDRSVHNNTLVEIGTVTESPVATGSELLGYSGFSGGNYLRQVHNTDLEYGTGNFYVIGWINISGYTGDVQRIVTNDSVEGTTGFNVELGTDQKITFRILESTNIEATVSDGYFTPGWNMFVAQRISPTSVEIFLNSSLDKSGAVVSRNVTNASATMRIGLTHAYTLPVQDELALIRTGAGSISAEQVAKIFNSEKILFQENVDCLLQGSSDTILDMNFDVVTEKLIVSTSDGATHFDNLMASNYTHTGENVVAVDAFNGAVVVGTDAVANFTRPTTSLLALIEEFGSIGFREKHLGYPDSDFQVLTSTTDGRRVWSTVPTSGQLDSLSARVDDNEVDITQNISDISALESDHNSFKSSVINNVVVGTGSFAGNGGTTTIAHGLASAPTFVTATAKTNPSGYLGEVWVDFDATNIYVGNSGSHTGDFTWKADIDITS